MANGRILFSLFLTYMVFAVLLNSVGTVIFQSIQYYRVSKEAASVLEGFKDLPIAAVSFLIASSLPRFGYRNAMMAGLGLVAAACLAMPLIDAFWVTKLLFFTIGCSFALVKVAVYSTVGLLTENSRQHASLLNLLEGFFMVGVLSGYWAFSLFIDPDAPESGAWLGVYWPLAALCAANIALVWSSPLDESAARREGPAPSLMREFRDMIALAAAPLVLVFIASIFLYVLIEQGVGTWLPTFNSEVFHLSARMSVQAASIYAACLALGRFAGAALLRFVDWRVFLCACLAGAAGLIVLTLPLSASAVPGAGYSWANAPLGAYLFPLIGLFMAPVYPALISIILSTFPKHRHAAMTGLIVIFSALGGTTGSLVTGRVFAAFSGPAAFYLTIAPIAGLFCLVMVMGFMRRARAAQA